MIKTYDKYKLPVYVLGEELGTVRTFYFGFCVLLLLPFVDDDWDFHIPMLGVVMAQQVLDTRVTL